MEKFMSYILGIVLFFYLFGIVGRFLLKLFITRKMNQFSKGEGTRGFFGGNFTNSRSNSSQNSTSSHREGEVFISNNSQKEKKIKDRVGEYVDYEEIK